MIDSHTNKTAIYKLYLT